MRGFDLTGRQFGRLIVLEYSHTHRYFRKNGTVASGAKVWKAECICGNVKLYKTGDLTSGRTLSCGCLHKEILSERAKRMASEKRMNLEGSTSGLLTYIMDMDTIVDGNRKILVKCVCGTEFECFAHSYIGGRTKSCGCLQKSIARVTIKQNRKELK